MTDVEKEESQKTVVAFITGLLIGGLLVWVFSSTPDDAKQPVEEETSTNEVVKTSTQSETVKSDTTNAKNEVVGEGSLVVANQKAGTSVELGATKIPTKNGWIVVRDYMDGVPGNILGAARYSADEGLMPTRVELMRSTTAGSSYQVVFFTNNGDLGFKVGEDTLIEGTSATFKAN